MSRRSDDELADLLRDLERDLDRLTDRLDAADAEDGDGSDDRRVPARRRSSRPRRSSGSESGPRAPSPGDLLRFTEEYTIPTVISALEATIQSLELVRGGLRLADPERRLREADESRSRTRSRSPASGGGVRGAVARELGGGASAAVERTLSDLRTALSATELPEDDESREILEDARALTDEIERRLAGSEGARDSGERERERDADRRGERRSRSAGRSGSASSGRGVGIEVRDAGDADRDGGSDGRGGGGGGGDEDRDGEGSDEENGAQVDVDAELESIRREMGGDDGTGDDGGEGAEGGDGDRE